jgi:hypothetical protein
MRRLEDRQKTTNKNYEYGQIRSQEAIPGRSGLSSRLAARGFKLFLPAIHAWVELLLGTGIHSRPSLTPQASDADSLDLSSANSVRVLCPESVQDHESLPSLGLSPSRHPNLVSVVRLHNMTLHGPSQFDLSGSSLLVFHKPSQHAYLGLIDEPQQRMRGQKPDRPDHPGSGSVTGEAQPQNHRANRQIGRFADLQIDGGPSGIRQ